MNENEYLEYLMLEITKSRGDLNKAIEDALIERKELSHADILDKGRKLDTLIVKYQKSLDQIKENIER